MKILQILILCFLESTIAVMAQTTHIRAVNFTTRDGLGSNVVNCGVQDRQGYLWFGTNHGLTRFDGHMFVNFYVDENGEKRVEGITHIIEDTVRNVLLMSGKDYRLLCFDLTQMAFVSAEGMKFQKAIDEEKAENKYMVRARDLGIERGNRTNRRHDLHYARLNDGREIFATIDNGFFVYEPQNGHLQHFCSTDKNPIIESDYINGILQDRSGSVWLLTTFAGIYRLDMGEEALLQHSLAPNIRAFAQIDDHHIAVADMENNVYSYNPDTRENKLVFHKGSRVYVINIDSKGDMWLGTRGDGIWVGKNGEYNRLQSLPARHIYDIVFAPDGTIWIATLDGGLIKGRKKSDETVLFSQSLQNEKIHELDLDEKGRLWIATENGIFRKDGTKVDTIFNKGKVVCICHAPDGTVWAGSNGYGLLKISGEGDNVEFVRVDNGLANNCVESVTCDREGNVFVGTDQGISIVNSADGSVHNIYSSQGLRANTYNENAILCSSNGSIFLGSLTGLVELKPNVARINGGGFNITPPLLTCIEVNDVLHYDYQADKIELSYDQNNLCFSFSSFAYNDLSSVIYSYWLEGVDRDWRPSTKESQALYTNLSPGHYRFHVRSRLAGTTWSEETVCEVIINQPWYWTWWARLLYLLIISLFFWYEWHQYQQRISLRRQLDQRLSALYAVKVQQEHTTQESPSVTDNAETFAEKSDIDAIPTTEESVREKVANQRDKDFLDKLDHLILENLLQTDLDVNFIAQEMCVSYSTLHRRIKSIAGMSANEYVRKHRLAKAMQLLRDGRNATEVSMQCGFNSPSYFTRCFKSEYGILPSEV